MLPAAAAMHTAVTPAPAHRLSAAVDADVTIADADFDADADELRRHVLMLPLMPSR